MDDVGGPARNIESRAQAVSLIAGRICRVVGVGGAPRQPGAGNYIESRVQTVSAAREMLLGDVWAEEDGVASDIDSCAKMVSSWRAMSLSDEDSGRGTTGDVLSREILHSRPDVMILAQRVSRYRTVSPMGQINAGLASYISSRAGGECDFRPTAVVSDIGKRVALI